MAYTKKLKTINVHLMLDNEVITIEDTAEDNKASRALMEFKRYDTMHYETTEDDVKVMNEIPYHAVQYIEVTEDDGSVDRKDPYGCEEGSDSVTIIFHTDCPNTPPNSGTPEPIVASKGETIIMPTIRTEASSPHRLWSESCDEEMMGLFEGDEFTLSDDSPSTIDFYYRYPTL